MAAPAALTRVLTERTDGHPLFLVAVVDALVQQGVLRVGPTGWELVGGLDAVHVGIPLSIRHVLEQQMALLSPADQALLAAASVAGVEFAVAAVAAGVQQAEEEVEAQCDALAGQHHVIQACGTAVWPDGTVTARYTFRHALYQALLYERVPGSRRRRWHRQIGRRLEAGYGPQAREIAAELAMHFGRGQEAPRAVRYLQQAGEKALEQSAYREAVGSFEQAFQTLVHLPEHSDTSVRALELRLALGRTLIELGEYGRSLTLLGEAEALARGLDDRPRLGQVLSWTSIARRITGDPEGAMAAGQQALELAAALGERVLQAQACLDLGQACNALGAFGRAAEWLQQSVEAADRAAGPPCIDLRIRARVWLAQTVSALGAFAEGRRYGEEALRLARREGGGELPIVVHTQLGTLSLIKGDLEHAIQVFDQGLARCRACGNQNQLPVIAGGLGAAYALQGHLAAGRALLEEAISESLRTGAVRGLADRVAWHSEVCRLAGHHEEAWQHARQALDLARQQQARGDEVHALHQLGAVHASTTPPQIAQAEAYYQQALVLAETLGMRPLQAHCHRSLGMLYTATSQWERAKTALSTAVEMYQGMDMTFWLPQTEAVLAQVDAP